jgi:hypothetical protein
MAYVKEENLEEPIQVPPESLFTILDDLQSPIHNPASTSVEVAMEGVTCIVEEEFLGEFLHLDSITSIHDKDSQVRTTAEEVKVVEVMDTWALRWRSTQSWLLHHSLLSLILAMLSHFSSIQSSSSSSSS